VSQFLPGLREEDEVVDVSSFVGEVAYPPVRTVTVLRMKWANVEDLISSLRKQTDQYPALTDVADALERDLLR
jgi:hypothetical protein